MPACLTQAVHQCRTGLRLRGPTRELIRTWPNLTETTVNGIQYVQEGSPDEIGTAIAEFVRKLLLSR